MADVVRARKLERLGDYRLKLWFSNGRSGEWDLSDMSLHQTRVIEPFKDPTYFARVVLEFCALTWPNDYDRASDALPTNLSSADAPHVEATRT